MEMLSIEETFLMVVISIITTRDTLGILIGLVATIGGKKIEIIPLAAYFVYLF